MGKEFMGQVILDKLKLHFDKYELKSYAPGSMITLANQEPEGISFLEKGVVEQYDITPGGNKLVVNIFKPSAFFPMSWAINKTPNAYFFGALTKVELRQANTEDTLIFLRANPDVLYDLLSRVYKGTDAILRRLVLAASDIAASRLIFELLVEAYRFGTDIEENIKLVNVKQSTLAGRSGLARETVSREIRKLEQENLISQTAKGLVIDVKSLERKLDLEV